MLNGNYLHGIYIDLYSSYIVLGIINNTEMIWSVWKDV